MTLQEIFDTVAKHLLTQNERSVLVGYKDMCAYRGTGGLKCAAGVLIKDEVYADRSLETQAAHSEEVRGALEDSGVPVFEPRVMELVGTLQTAHDYSEPEDWPGYLREIAKGFGLSDAVLG